MKSPKFMALLLGALLLIPGAASACTMQEAMDKMSKFSQAVIAAKDQSKTTELMAKAQAVMTSNMDADGKIDYDKVCSAYDDLMKQVSGASPSAAAPATGSDTCRADFNAINQIKPEAGPFEVDVESRTLMSTLSPPGAPEKPPVEVKINIQTQTVPPNSFRTVMIRPNGRAEAVVINGEKGWVKAGQQWTEIPHDKLAANLAAQPLKVYFGAGTNEITCNGEQTVDGKTYLSFSYTRLAGNIPMQVTDYFDPATRLPVKEKGVGVKDGQPTLDVTYKFDPTIKIEPPVAQ